MDSNKHEGENENVQVINLPSQIYQLQALASELKSGFTEAMQELSRIQHGEDALEEKVKSCRCTMEEKVTELKNSLNYLKEEVNNAMEMIRTIVAKQEEMQQKIEQLQQEKRRESRKAKAKRAQKEEHGSQTIPNPQQAIPYQPSNIPEPILINQHFPHLLQTADFEKAQCGQTVHTQNSPIQASRGPGLPSSQPDAEENYKSSLTADAQPRVQFTSLMWRQPKESSEWEEEHIINDQGDCPKDSGQSRTGSLENMLSEMSSTGKRQNAAADLLESERKYVLNLSLILKIKAALHDADLKRSTKEKSFFPNSLRHLTQLHLDLLHTLQERVLKWSRQGILGDIFLKLTNDENNFLDYYVAYLRDLPECISVIHIVILKEVEEDIKSDLYVLLFHVVQRIPEYLIHLQKVLKYTEQEHPDYYLLLVCVQRLRVFISHYNLLLQYDEELLIQKRKKLKKSSMVKMYKGLASQGQEVSPSLSATSIRDSGIQSDEMQQFYPPTSGSSSAATNPLPPMKSSQQTLTENIKTMTLSDWEIDGRKVDRSENVLVPTSFCSTDQELKAILAPLQAIPEMEYESAPPVGTREVERSIKTSTELLTDVSFTPGYEDFEYGGEIIGLPSSYEVESFRNRSLFESCSPASSESSLDICFLRPINCPLESDQNDRTLQPLLRSCTSPVSSTTYRHDTHHIKNKPLSRSLKEYPRTPDSLPPRLYSTRSSSTSRQQTKVDRSTQSHGKSPTSRSSQRNIHLPTQHQGESRPLLEDIHVDDNARFFQKEDIEQTSFSEHQPRQDQKGGLRRSFRRLFRKK
ncbi:rho guanine nucleotide exchange factor 33 [Ambystoma mexicanum]|uniref:rho guanine nucleotide exchange factor 33 n=1 Tax=Ambystoma mexicanum TaxID=8296 RepID=UPI0037E7B0C5